MSVNQRGFLAALGVYIVSLPLMLVFTITRNADWLAWSFAVLTVLSMFAVLHFGELVKAERP